MATRERSSDTLINEDLRNTLLACESVLGLIYHRESSGLTQATKDQVYRTLGDVEYALDETALTNRAEIGMAPKRIQRKRTKGWKMPENAVSVTRPGRYGNPFHIQMPMVDSVESVLGRFTEYAVTRMNNEPTWLEPLRGKDLACWCKEGSPCHADILLGLANGRRLE